MALSKSDLKARKKAELEKEQAEFEEKKEKEKIYKEKKVASETKPKTETKPKVENQTEVTPKKTANNAAGKAQQFSNIANKPASFSAKAISSEAPTLENRDAVKRETQKNKSIFTVTQNDKINLKNREQLKAEQQAKANSEVKKFVDNIIKNAANDKEIKGRVTVDNRDAIKAQIQNDVLQTNPDGSYASNLARGLGNRFRSTVGNSIEEMAGAFVDSTDDVVQGYSFGDEINLDNREAARAYAMGQNSAWFVDPLRAKAEEIANTRNAGKVYDLATEQIANAQEGTNSQFARDMISAADSSVQMAAYMTLPGGNKYLSAYMAIPAAAERYNEERAKGASKEEAATRAAATGAISYAVESLGGIGKFQSNVIEEIAAQNFFTNLAAQFVAEGGEELLDSGFQYVADVLADLMFKGEIQTTFNPSEVFHKAWVGGLAGAGFGLTNSVSNSFTGDAQKDATIKEVINDIVVAIKNTRNTKDFSQPENTPNVKAPVAPVEPPVIGTEKVTPEVQNEQESAFANVREKVEAEKENNVEKAPEETLKILRERFDKGEISKEEYLAKNYENLSKYFEERKNANAQVNSTNDVVNSVNDVVEQANAQPRAQGDGGFGENTVGAAQSNPTSYAHLQNEHGVHEQGEGPAARDSNVPLKDAYGNQTSKATATIMDAKVTPDELIPAFEKEVAAGTFANRGTTNKETVDKAAQKIASYKTLDEAVNDFRKVYSDDKILSKDDLVFGEILYSMAAEKGANDTAIELASMLVSNNSRTGDAMQAQRILKRLSPEGRLYHAQQIAGKFNKDKHQKSEIKLSEETVKKVLDAKTDEEIEAANDAVAEDIAKQIDIGFWDDLASMWNAWRYLSMLGNPKTHIRNIFGNLAFLPVRKIKNVIKAGIESGAYKAGWINEKTASVKLASKENREFAKESFEKNKKALLSGGNYRFESEIDSKIEPFRFTGKETPVKKFWNAILTPARKEAEFNSNALEAEDVWFLESAYIDSLTQYLTANKIDAQNITPKQKTKAENYAAQEAKKATYRDDSAIANALEKLSNTEISFKGIKIKLRPFVDAVVPFRKTPINILARAVEYSPVGLATTLALDGRAVKNGDITANEMIDHVSSGLTGSGIYALGIALALKGVLTGGEDEDKNEKEFAKLQGEQPYALKIGDGSYTLDWLAPTAIPLFLGAETVRVLKKEYGEDEKWDDVVWEILVNLDKIANPMLELSMLQNLDSFLGSNYSKDGNALSGLAQDLIASYVLQAVPTLSSQIAQTKDGTRRNAYYVDKTDKIPDEWQIPLQRAMAKIPGLSEKLPAYVDAWGREQKQNENIGVRIVENFLSPGYYKKKTVTEVDEMLKQLYADTGESSILPKNFAKSFKVDGENLNLSGKQYVDAQKKKGQTAYNMLEQLIADKDFKKLSSEQKASIVSDVYSYANVKGKQEVSNYATDTKWYKNIEEAKSKHGISNADYLIAQNHYSNLDGDDKKIKMLDQLVADKGTSAKQDVALMEYIAGVDMSKYKKATSEPSKQLALYKIKNDANKNNIEQIQKEFKEDVYGAREIYYKSEGDWNYDIDDVINNGKNRDKKVSVYKKFGLSEEDIVKGYNATIGYNKKEDLMAALTDAFGSKKKATTFYNIYKGKKGYK